MKLAKFFIFDDEGANISKMDEKDFKVFIRIHQTIQHEKQPHEPTKIWIEEFGKN